MPIYVEKYAICAFCWNMWINVTISEICGNRIKLTCLITDTQCDGSVHWHKLAFSRHSEKYRNKCINKLQDNQLRMKSTNVLSIFYLMISPDEMGTSSMHVQFNTSNAQFHRQKYQRSIITLVFSLCSIQTRAVALFGNKYSIQPADKPCQPQQAWANI